MEKLMTDELRGLAMEAGFDTLDQSELFDVVFGTCDCCCYENGSGNNTGC